MKSPNSEVSLALLLQPQLPPTLRGSLAAGGMQAWALSSEHRLNSFLN